MEVPERVPVCRKVQIPVHVPVKVPIKVPVYVKQFVPNYIKKDVIIEKKVCPTYTNIVNVDKPVICETVKRVNIEVPVFRKSIVPVVQTNYIQKPYPVVEYQRSCCA